MAAVKEGKGHIVVQPNLNAEDKSVRELAAKNSHTVIAEAAIDPKNDPDAEKTKEDLVVDFEKRRGGGSGKS